MLKQKIMLIENDKLLSKAICICLSKKGYEVEAFLNPEQAVKRLLQIKPDSILIDLERPGCGVSCISELMEKFGWAKRVPIILLYGVETEIVRATGIKYWAHIQKPFDMGELVQTIERSLNKPKLSSIL